MGYRRRGRYAEINHQLNLLAGRIGVTRACCLKKLSRASREI